MHSALLQESRKVHCVVKPDSLHYDNTSWSAVTVELVSREHSKRSRSYSLRGFVTKLGTSLSMHARTVDHGQSSKLRTGNRHSQALFLEPEKLSYLEISRNFYGWGYILTMCRVHSILAATQRAAYISHRELEVESNAT